MNRQQRRKRERHQAKQPVIIAGDGIVARALEGSQFEGKPAAQLPPKVAGEHRWVAMASYVLSLDDAKGAYDADRQKFLDHENLFMLGIVCWDCEQALLEDVAADSRCPAPAAP